MLRALIIIFGLMSALLMPSVAYADSWFPAQVETYFSEDKNVRVTVTPRQLEVLQKVARGHSTKEIARLLGLSVKTVDTHRSQLMKQLDIHEVTGLVRYALRTGLISADG